jgi:hypothetical protein
MTATITALFTEDNRLDDIIPASRTSVEANTGWLSMRDYHQAAFIIQAGAIAAAGIVSAEILQATDEFGAGSKAISGKAIAALDGTEDNAICVIELNASELDVTNRYDYILGSISHGGAAACVTSGLMIRLQPRFKPVDDSNLAEVVT